MAMYSDVAKTSIIFSSSGIVWSYERRLSRLAAFTNGDIIIRSSPITDPTHIQVSTRVTALVN